MYIELIYGTDITMNLNLYSFIIVVKKCRPKNWQENEYNILCLVLSVYMVVHLYISQGTTSNYQITGLKGFSCWYSGMHLGLPPRWPWAEHSIATDFPTGHSVLGGILNVYEQYEHKLSDWGLKEGCSGLHCKLVFLNSELLLNGLHT